MGLHRRRVECPAQRAPVSLIRISEDMNLLAMQLGRDIIEL
jgi:hypothetical protein